MLRTGPSLAMQQSETIWQSGLRRHSIDGIKATSKRPSAKPSASRLGKSTSILASGASRARQNVSGQAFRYLTAPMRSLSGTGASI